MAEKDAKERLVDLLDRRAFRPVLEASPDDYHSDAERRKLKDVQAATRRERDRFRREYGSANEVCEMFRYDLGSDEAREVERDLRDLDLPALRDVEDEFEGMCRRLGVD